MCSGRSNLGLCDASIQVKLGELESAVEAELSRLIALCPKEYIPEGPDGETAQALKAIEQKIEHLISAIAQGSELTVPYINRAIQQLDAQRKALLEQQSRSKSRARGCADRIHVSSLSFEEKKLVAAQFIRVIKLNGDRAEVIWNV